MNLQMLDKNLIFEGAFFIGISHLNPEKILTNNHQDLESKTLYFLAIYHPAYTNSLQYQKISHIQKP